MIARSARIRRALQVLGLVFLTGALFASCQLVSLLFGVTIDQRVQDFSSGYTSGDYANLYKNFSDSTQQKNAMKDPTFWDSTPFASIDNPHALTSYNITGSTVSGTFSNDNGTFSLTMTMEQSGIDWYILSVTLSPTFTTSAGDTVIKRIR